MPWREQLNRILGHQEKRREGMKPTKEDVRQFLRETVTPALRSVAEELTRHGKEVEIESEPDEVSVTVYDEDQEEEFFYAVKARAFRKPTFALTEQTLKDDDASAVYRTVVYTRDGSQSYGLMGYTKDQVIANFLHEYDKQIRWQKPSKRTS